MDNSINSSPTSFKETFLEKAYPNPFNPQTFINYHLSKGTWIRISVFDIHGRLVKNLYSGQQTVGRYHVYWDGLNGKGAKVASGSYLIRMHTKDVVQIQKVILMR